MNASIGSIDPRIPMVLSVAGFAVMLACVIAYVLEPLQALQAGFAAGLVLLAAGYALLYLGHRSATAEEALAERDEDINGYFYILDEDYSGDPGDATIEDLTGRQ